MKNPNLIPYEIIVRATNGEPEAVDEVLRHYSKRILKTGILTELPLYLYKYLFWGGHIS